jgi:hypothetical protein
LEGGRRSGEIQVAHAQRSEMKAKVEMEQIDNSTISSNELGHDYPSTHPSVSVFDDSI